MRSLTPRISRPHEEIALVLMIDLLAQPLAATLVVPRPDRPRTEIKLPALVRPRLVHAELLRRLPMDRAERRRYGREERGPGRYAGARIAPLIVVVLLPLAGRGRRGRRGAVLRGETYFRRDGRQWGRR